MWEKVGLYCIARQTENDIIIQKDLSENGRFWRGNLLISGIIYLVFNCIFIFAAILFSSLILIIIWIPSTLILIIPEYIIYHHYKERVIAVKIDNISGKVLYQKIQPKFEVLKEYNLTQVVSLKYSNFWKSLFFIMENKKKFKIFYGTKKECKNMSRKISKFLSIPII